MAKFSTPTLLVDFNSINNQDISTIFDVKNKKTLNSIDSKIQTITTKKSLKVKLRLKENNLKNIIIDLGNEIEEKEKQKILELCNINIILLEPTVIGIKKAKTLINYYKNTLKINPKSLKILINKKDKHSIDTKIIKNVIKQIKILGEIDMSTSFTVLINNKFKNISLLLNKNEIQNIKKIIKNF